MSGTDQHHRPMFGILLKLLAVLFLSTMAAAVKYLGQDVPVGQTIFVRSLIAAATMALIAFSSGRMHLLTTGNWRSHALRSSAGAGGMFLWFLALSQAPIADVTAVTYMTPIFLTLLATLLLGERFRVHRGTAIAIGCTGAVIMISPYLSLNARDSVGIALAMGSALLSAFAMMFLRGMSRIEHPITITFYFSLTTLAGAAITALWGWPLPSARQWALIMLIGVLGTAAQLLQTIAYRYAEASIIAPLEYSSMIVIVLLGYFLFDEIPGRSIWIGAPLVMAAGLLILWREYQLRDVPTHMGRTEERPTT
jgi:drug/metabolite transporter (DMT)-like permease